jgi:hypothetical protein
VFLVELVVFSARFSRGCCCSPRKREEWVQGVVGVHCLGGAGHHEWVSHLVFWKDEDGPSSFVTSISMAKVLTANNSSSSCRAARRPAREESDSVKHGFWF